jgi:hypothetical protein
MVTGGEVQNALTGIGLLARNRKEGFNWLDLSADGFWTSFMAIPMVIPAFAVTWASYRIAYLAQPGDQTAGPAFFAALAATDLINWLLPIVILAALSRPLGIRQGFVRWVVATNWLNVPVAYAMAIPTALGLMLPGLGGAELIAQLAVFVLAVVAFFRITRLSLGTDIAITIALVAMLLVLSIMTTETLNRAFGVALGG